MDPQATLNELLDAVASRKWDDVRELSDSLLSWMQRGEFPPITLGSESLGKGWHRAIATYVCMSAIASANKAEKRRERRRGGA